MKKRIILMFIVVVMTSTACATTTSDVEYILTIIVEPSMKFDVVRPMSSFMVKIWEEVHRTETGFQTFKYGIADGRTGQIVLPVEYDEIRDFRDGLVAVRKDEKWGFVNINGDITVPFIYDNVYDFSEEFAAVSVGEWYEAEHPMYGLEMRYNGKWGFIDTNGNTITSLEYDWVNSFSEGLAVVGIDRKSGFINTSGDITVPIEYDSVHDFSEGRAGVYIDRKGGFINTSGELIIPMIYDRVGYYEDFGSSDSGLYVYMGFQEGFAAVQLDSKWGMVDVNGKIVIPLEYDRVRNFNGGLAVVGIGIHHGGNQGVVNTKGKFVFPINEDDWVNISCFHNGMASIWDVRGGGFGIINAKGELIVPFGTYYGEVSFSEDLALVCSGEVIKYEHYGVPATRIDRNYGFINKQGEIVIPIEYDTASVFQNGMARVLKDNNHNYINKNGEAILPDDYSGMFHIGSENGVAYFWVLQGETNKFADCLVGIVSVSGNFPNSGASV